MDTQHDKCNARGCISFFQVTGNQGRPEPSGLPWLRLEYCTGKRFLGGVSSQRDVHAHLVAPGDNRAINLLGVAERAALEFVRSSRHIHEMENAVGAEAAQRWREHGLATTAKTDSIENTAHTQCQPDMYRQFRHCRDADSGDLRGPVVGRSRYFLIQPKHARIGRVKSRGTIIAPAARRAIRRSERAVSRL